VGASLRQTAIWEICLFGSLLGIVCGCQPSYHVTPAGEFSSKYQWGWPVDTIGPYLITARLMDDGSWSGVSQDSSAYLSGAVVSSYYSKNGGPGDWSLVPALIIDSVALGFPGNRPDLLFPVTVYPASHRTDDGRFFSGTGMRLNRVALPDSSLCDHYSYVALLIQPGTDSILVRRIYSHDFNVLRKPGDRTLTITPSYSWPFSPTNMITYEVPDSCAVNCVVFNVTGQAVDTLVDELLPPGLYLVNWDPHNLTSGVYFARWTICGVETTKKLALLK
jgi:hypothetical protein